MFPITVPKRFRVIAHRGAAAYAPENTAAAFKLAYDLGAREFELDTRITTDGVVVLCHDSSLDRFGHEGVKVEQSSWYDLANLDMGSWFSPHFYKGEKFCSLENLFKGFGQEVTYHIELKGDNRDLPGAVFNLLDCYGLKEHCIVTSFSKALLSEMYTKNETIRLGWLLRDWNSQIRNCATTFQFFQLCPHTSLVNRDLVSDMKRHAQEVRAWGVPKPALEAQRALLGLLEAGVDGVTVGAPDWLKGKTQ